MVHATVGAMTRLWSLATVLGALAFTGGAAVADPMVGAPGALTPGAGVTALESAE